MSRPAWQTPVPGSDAARELTPAYFSHPSYGRVLQRLVAELIAGLAARLRHGGLTA
jgi:hypothetical protein